jgi:serine/threonine protein phosphatase PrpC
MLQAGIEALFGRNRDHHRKRHLFRLRRRQNNHKEEVDELASLFLDKPHTEKELIHGSNFVYVAMQGWRSTMEDKHKHLTSFDNRSWKLWAYYSIFDGHNGTDTARNAADHLDIHLLDAFNQMLAHQNDEKIKNGEPVRSSQLDISQLRAAIKQTYFELDKDLRKMVKDESGCVCITCLIGPEQIYLINIGDSRAIVISNDGHVLACTEDHKPDDPAEQERIHEAGGTISKPCAGDVLRVDNQLAMTRVLGDFSMDKHVVPPMADIVQYPRNSSAAYVVLACDGIWDVMTNEDVASFIIERAATTTLDNIASHLLDECLRRTSTDNMSVYIIKL